MGAEHRRAAALFDQMYAGSRRRYHPVEVLYATLKGNAEFEHLRGIQRLSFAEALVDAGVDFLQAVNSKLPEQSRFTECLSCGSLYCLTCLPFIPK